MRESPFDCVVLDLKLPDISGFDLLTEIQQDPKLRETPIVVFTGRDLSQSEEDELRKKAKSIVLKGVRSPERLLDETALFLHRVIADLPESKQQMIETLHQSDEPLAGRKVLVVDDDIRNIFALNSLLERHGMSVVSATTGQDAINLLEKTDSLALVLMDIMMPEMDGYETMRRIRGNPKFRYLPIIALTAKAMKGDRDKCLEAGASDYVAKPVNTDQLLSLVRMWLHR
jgi:CheY-like chemotaxis protein